MDLNLQFFELADKISLFCDEFKHDCKGECYYFNTITNMCPFKKVTGCYPYEWWGRKGE